MSATRSSAPRRRARDAPWRQVVLLQEDEVGSSTSQVAHCASPGSGVAGICDQGEGLGVVPIVHHFINVHQCAMESCTMRPAESRAAVDLPLATGIIPPGSTLRSRV